MLNKNILLVEDDVDDQLLFLEALRESDAACHCITVNNGQEALDHFADEQPTNLIFMDINMPVMNGMECLISLKQMEMCVAIPIIMLTTTHDAATIKRVRMLGAYAFFQKPSNYGVFVQKLTTLLACDFDTPRSKETFFV